RELQSRQREPSRDGGGEAAGVDRPVPGKPAGGLRRGGGATDGDFPPPAAEGAGEEGGHSAPIQRFGDPGRWEETHCRQVSAAVARGQSGRIRSDSNKNRARRVG